MREDRGASAACQVGARLGGLLLIAIVFGLATGSTRADDFVEVTLDTFHDGRRVFVKFSYQFRIWAYSPGLGMPSSRLRISPWRSAAKSGTP